MAADSKLRLNSYLARCGLGSRRGCEKLILEGRVSVDGRLVESLSTMIEPSRQSVLVDGQPAVPEANTYLLYYKPAGVLCSRVGQKGARTIYHFLPRRLGHLFYVGRLDRDTEGLLFLTNDGDWAQRISHPRHQVEKTYVAEVVGQLDRAAMDRAIRGVRDEGERLRLERIRKVRLGKRGAIYELVLREGKKREIRRLFRALGHPVAHLKRIRIGRIGLGTLRPGEWKPLSPSEVAAFR